MENETSFLIAQQVGAIAIGVLISGSIYVLYIILRDYINGKK